MSQFSDALDTLKKQITIPLLAAAVKMLLDAISPQLREMIRAGLSEWEAKAQTTANPWDDLLVRFLRVLFA